MLPDTSFPTRDNRITREDLRSRIDIYCRAPFKDMLSTFLQCRPDPASILAWAMEHPDKWASAITMFARLSGYTDTTVVQHQGAIGVYDMSDAELMQKLSELRSRLLGDNTQEDGQLFTNHLPTDTKMIEQQSMADVTPRKSINRRRDR